MRPLLSCRVEFVPRDLWVGVYWRRWRESTAVLCWRDRLDVWVCLLPCLPIHFVFGPRR